MGISLISSAGFWFLRIVNQVERIGIVSVFFLGVVLYSQSQGQNQDYRGRVGINTLEPKATLDVSRKDLGSLPLGQSQGVLFPEFTTDERDAFENVKAGTMIYNTDEQCLEICVSSSRGPCEWQCMMSRVPSLGATLSNTEIYVLSLSDSRGNYQGKIDDGSNKIKVMIPYSGGLGSYKGITIERMSAVGEDGTKKKLVLKIPEGKFHSSGSGFLEGEIQVADGGEYLVKQLSIGDQEIIAEFELQSGFQVSKVLLTATGGIVDRCFNKTTKDCWGYGENIQEHQFVYFPIEGPDGRIWLSQNLGAEYSNIESSNFNPGKGDFSVDDFRAYGSLFQWQRPSDGHELINWSSSTAGTSKYASSSSVSTNSNWRPGHNRFITSNTSENSWVNLTLNISSSNMDLWKSGGANNPCPERFHVPTDSELEALNRALTSNGNQIWNHSDFRLPASGARNFNNANFLVNQRTKGIYWSSERNEIERRNYLSKHLDFDSRSSRLMDDAIRGAARAVRCIKD